MRPPGARRLLGEGKESEKKGTKLLAPVRADRRAPLPAAAAFLLPARGGAGLWGWALPPPYSARPPGRAAPPVCWPSRAESSVRGERAGRPAGASAGAGAWGRRELRALRAGCSVLLLLLLAFLRGTAKSWGRLCLPERGPAQPRLPRAGGLASLKASSLLISSHTCASLCFFRLFLFFTLRNWACAVVTVRGVIL